MSVTKIAIVGAIAAAVGAIGAAVGIGEKVREDTVVANPYEEGLRLTEGARQACDLGAGPCALPLDGGGEVTLEIAPRPVRTMAELRVRAVVREPSLHGLSEGASAAEEVVVSFSMAGMNMGRNEVRLAPEGGPRQDDSRVGTAILVRCPSGRRDWIAEVRVGRPGGPVRTARFPFAVEE